MRAAFGTGERMTVSNWTGDVNLKIVIFDFVVFWSVASGAWHVATVATRKKFWRIRTKFSRLVERGTGSRMALSVWRKRVSEKSYWRLKLAMATRVATLQRQTCAVVVE